MLEYSRFQFLSHGIKASWSTILEYLVVHLDNIVVVEEILKCMFVVCSCLIFECCGEAS